MSVSLQCSQTVTSVTLCIHLAPQKSNEQLSTSQSHVGDAILY
jgi:hypothetical protein